jgi:transposase
MARHRSFSSEFKRQLAREFLEGHAGMHELARRYGLSRNLIRLWVRKYEAGEFTDEMAEAVRIAEYEHKIAELERKVGQLTMEVDLLKNGARLGRAGNDANYSIVSGPGPSPSRKDEARAMVPAGR